MWYEYKYRWEKPPDVTGTYVTTMGVRKLVLREGGMGWLVSVWILPYIRLKMGSKIAAPKEGPENLCCGRPAWGSARPSWTCPASWWSRSRGCARWPVCWAKSARHDGGIRIRIKASKNDPPKTEKKFLYWSAVPMLFSERWRLIL